MFSLRNLGNRVYTCRACLDDPAGETQCTQHIELGLASVRNFTFNMCTGRKLEASELKGLNTLLLPNGHSDIQSAFFKGLMVSMWPRTVFNECHVLGRCIPDPQEFTIVRPTGESKGSCALNIYFLHCDGKYKNAIQDAMHGISGPSVLQQPNVQQHKIQVNEANDHVWQMVREKAENQYGKLKPLA